MERILDYTTRVPHEAAAINDVRPPKDWPAKGAVELKGMDLTYPVTGQTVIKGLSVNILAGTSGGIPCLEGLQIDMCLFFRRKDRARWANGSGQKQHADRAVPTRRAFSQRVDCYRWYCDVGYWSSGFKEQFGVRVSVASVP